jgi:hypothetical protein
MIYTYLFSYRATDLYMILRKQGKQTTLTVLNVNGETLLALNL